MCSDEALKRAYQAGAAAVLLGQKPDSEAYVRNLKNRPFTVTLGRGSFEPKISFPDNIR